MTFAVAPLVGWEGIGIWIAAICTLGVYSILVGENKVSRFFEHVFLAAGGAYVIVVSVDTIIRPMWWDPMVSGFGALRAGTGAPGFWAGFGGVLRGLLAVVLGSFWYFTYSKRYNWLSRVVIGIMMGTAAGLAFKANFGLYVPQIRDSFKPLWTGSLRTSVDNTLFVVTLLCVMLYFFFAFERRNKVISGGANIGRWLLMICFGAMFGNTVMARMSLFIGRLEFLLVSWLGLRPS